jgi:hypothetical protein
LYLIRGNKLYEIERQQTKVELIAINETEMQIELKNDLGNTVFNYLLTIKVKVPSD